MYYIIGENVIVTDNILNKFLYDDNTIFELARESCEIYDKNDCKRLDDSIGYQTKRMIRSIFKMHADEASVLFFINPDSYLYDLIKFHAKVNQNRAKRILCYIDFNIYMNYFIDIPQLHKEKEKREIIAKKDKQVISWGVVRTLENHTRVKKVKRKRNPYV